MCAIQQSVCNLRVNISISFFLNITGMVIRIGPMYLTLPLVLLDFWDSHFCPETWDSSYPVYCVLPLSLVTESGSWPMQRGESGRQEREKDREYP